MQLVWSAIIPTIAPGLPVGLSSSPGFALLIDIVYLGPELHDVFFLLARAVFLD